MKLSVQYLMACAALILLAAMPACRGKKKTAESATTDTTHIAVATTGSSIVTTPVNMLVFVHKVKEYSWWKSAYDAHDSLRLVYGLHNYVVGRGLYDSNLVMVALKLDDQVKAKQFVGSADLKNAMNKAGVVGVPESYFVQATWQDTSAIGRLPRSVTTMQVKDWDTWWKSFQDGERERLDHGLKARLVGHDPEDVSKVSVVSALTDTSSALAYFRSDLLKERMKAAGVIGEPKRRLFQFVQRY